MPLITFEGGDGVGKTTQIKLLEQYLTRQGNKVTCVREPGGTALGQQLRDILKTQHMDPVTELLLFSAARNELLETVIRPALSRGEYVLCDRYYHSTIAYQGYGRQMDLSMVTDINNYIVKNTVPNRVFMFVLDKDIASQRCHERGGRDKFDAEGAEFHTRVQVGFSAAFRDSTNVCYVDASLSIQDLHNTIVAKIY